MGIKARRGESRLLPKRTDPARSKPHSLDETLKGWGTRLCGAVRGGPPAISTMSWNQFKRGEWMLVAGVDLGGTAVNYTLLNDREEFLIDGMWEHPSRSTAGP